jgi:para-nitrobenzyl esterase
VLAKHPLGVFQSANVALAAVATDSGWLCTARAADRWLSTYTPTFAYEFNDRNAPVYLPPVSFPYGAAHTTELQFLFPGFHGGTGASHPFAPEEQRLSDQMVSYWTQFAASGNPNSFETPYWPRYWSAADDFQSLDTPNARTEYNFDQVHQCDFWDQLLNLQNVL